MSGFLCLIPVVGVKLDISAWMASFINTTYRMDVSRALPAWHIQFAQGHALFVILSALLYFQCNDEICDCERNSKVRRWIAYFYVLSCYLWTRVVSMQRWSNLSVIPDCRLFHSGWRGLPGDVQSRWWYFSGGSQCFIEGPWQGNWYSVLVIDT